jgi:hypothetical protein
MTTAAEGRQIPINTASKPQLRAFLTHLGGKPTNFMDEGKLIDAIRAQDFEESFIIVPDGAPVAGKPAKAATSKLGLSATVMQEPLVSLTVHTSEGPGGKRAVFVGVNGRALLIPRGKRSDNVKLRYLQALENAVETKYEYDEDAKANLPRDMPSYNFQVHSGPTDAEKKAWYAYEAAEDLKAAAAERAAKRAA